MIYSFAYSLLLYLFFGESQSATGNWVNISRRRVFGMCPFPGPLSMAAAQVWRQANVCRSGYGSGWRSFDGGIYKFREALNQSARADGGRFCHSRKLENPGNTGCISRFSNCTDGAKDSPLSRRRFIRRFLRKNAEKSMENTGHLHCVYDIILLGVVCLQTKNKNIRR